MLKKLLNMTLAVLVVFGTLGPAPFLSAVARAATPDTISYQGRLRDDAGVVVADGSYDFTFSLYDDPGAGAVDWTEDQAVTVTDGYFSVQLGAVDPFNDNAGEESDLNAARWLSVVVEGETLAPRVAINSVAYAMTSRAVESLAAEPAAEDSYGGRMYYNTTDGQLYVYDATGPGWVSATGAGSDTNIGTDNLTLTGDRVLAMDGNSLTLDGSTGDVVFGDDGSISTDGQIVTTGALRADGGITTNAGALTINPFTYTAIGLGMPGVATGVGDLYVTNDFEVAGTATLASLDVGGGYGDAGATIGSNGNLSANGDLTVDGTSNLSDLSVGGGYGDNGAAIDTDGNLRTDGTVSADGKVTVNGGFESTAGEVLVSAGDVQLNTGVTLELGSTSEFTIDYFGGQSTIRSTTGPLNVNASGGAINIGDAADNQAINVGTMGIRPIAVGNADPDSTLELTGGNDWSVAADGTASFLSVAVGGGYGSGGATIADDGSGSFEGIIAGAGGLDVDGGDVFLNNNSAFDTNIGTGASSGAITIGGTAGSVIAIGTDNAVADTIGIGSAVDALTIASSGLNVASTGAITGALSVAVGGGFGDIVDGGATIGDEGDIQMDGFLSVGSTLDVSGNSTLASLDVGGGYGSTGVTLASNGNVTANGTLTVDGTTKLGDSLAFAFSALGNRTIGMDGDDSNNGLSAPSLTISASSKTNEEDFGNGGDLVLNAGAGTSGDAGTIFVGAANTDRVTIAPATSVTGTLTANGDLRANGVVILGDNGDTVAINSSDWDIDATGAMTGIGALTMDGNFSQTGATTFGTGTGDVSLNGNTVVTGTLGATGNSTLASLDVGGGYGSTGITLASNGNVTANGTITVDGAATIGGDVTLGASSGRLIRIADASGASNAPSLTINASQYADTGDFNGGDLVLNAGGSDSEGSGIAGNVLIGSGSTSTQISGGYGSLGVTIASNGDMETNGTITADQSASIAGGYGSTGVSISSIGNIQTNGTLTVDQATALNGNMTLGDAAGDTLTVSSSTLGLLKEAAHIIQVNASTTADTAGGALTVRGAAGNGTGDGGATSILAGISGSGATGNGGLLSLAGGAAASTNGNGGSVTIDAGARTGTGAKGDIAIGGTNAQNVNIGSGLGVISLNDGTINVGTTSPSQITIGSTNNNQNTILGQSTDTNTISIGAGATADTKTQTINIGTGVGVGTGKSVIFIGETNGASSLTLNSGTGNIDIGKGNQVRTIGIGNNTAGNTIAIGINNTTADTISIGSAIDSLTIASVGFSVSGAGAVTLSNAVDAASDITTGAGQTLKINPGASSGAIGGSLTLVGGVGSAGFAGGVATVTGGLSGATDGDTGGAARLVGGTSAATNGVGGAVQMLGGAGTGAGAGGAILISGGASAGATGTAGGVSIDSGARSGGTAGSVLIGTNNASDITLGKTTSTNIITIGQSTKTNTINIGNNGLDAGQTQFITIGDGGGGLGDNITIGSSATTSVLNLNAGSGGITVTAPVGVDGTMTERVCTNVGTGDHVALTGVQLGDCDSTGQADFAEMYPVETGATYGDIVVPGPQAVTTQDGNTIALLVKSSVAYQGPVSGILSDNHQDGSVAGFNVDASDNPMPVALVGRVPVNVTDENGPIAVGDFVTTSSTAGKGMKATEAGRVIGMALSSFDGTDGQVMVQVVNTWYQPDASEASALQGGSDSLLSVASGDLTVSGDATFEGSVRVAEHLVGSSDMAGRAHIVAGDTRVHVAFENEYAEQPIVNATLRSDVNIPGHWWIDEESSTGFDIVLDGTLASDVEFNWIAVGVDGGEVSVSDGSTRDIELYVLDGSAPVAEAAPVVDAPADVPTDEPVVADEAVVDAAPVVDEPVVDAAPVADEPVVEPAAEEVPPVDAAVE